MSPVSTPCPVLSSHLHQLLWSPLHPSRLMPLLAKATGTLRVTPASWQAHFPGVQASHSLFVDLGHWVLD